MCVYIDTYVCTYTGIPIHFNGNCLVVFNDNTTNQYYGKLINCNFGTALLPATSFLQTIYRMNKVLLKYVLFLKNTVATYCVGTFYKYSVYYRCL